MHWFMKKAHAHMQATDTKQNFLCCCKKWLIFSKQTVSLQSILSSESSLVSNLNVLSIMDTKYIMSRPHYLVSVKCWVNTSTSLNSNYLLFCWNCMPTPCEHIKLKTTAIKQNTLLSTSLDYSHALVGLYNCKWAKYLLYENPRLYL